MRYINHHPGWCDRLESAFASFPWGQVRWWRSHRASSSRNPARSASIAFGTWLEPVMGFRGRLVAKSLQTNLIFAW